MAGWTERLVGAAFLLAALIQAGGPSAAPAGAAVRRAVLLQDGDFFDAPDSDGDILARFPAGTVLDYVGETTDAFGRTWFTVRNPDRIERSAATYLVPFTAARFAQLGYRAAALADRQPLTPAAAAIAAAAAAAARAAGVFTVEPPWWHAAAELEFDDNLTFQGMVAVSAHVVGEAELAEAIDLLGGVDALAAWPAAPLPGELFVPPLLPVLFEFDGSAWRPARPPRLVGPAVSLIGNTTFEVDRRAPALAGGPSLYCWSLFGAVDPRGNPAGGAQVAPPATPVVGTTGPPVDMGVFSPVAAPQTLQAFLPPAPPATLVPARVDQPVPAAGVLLTDNDGRQAVYLEQTLPPAMTARLRGRRLALDVVARNPPTATSSSTFGVDIEFGYAGGKPKSNVWEAFTAAAHAMRFSYAFDVPPDAETLTVRLLPLDRMLARDQTGAVVFERAALRLASWKAAPAGATIVLYRVTAASLVGAPLHTRAPMAITMRSEAAVARIWPDISAADWSDDDKRHVIAAEIRHGMGPEQVRAAWGDPVSVTGDEVNGRWQYADRYAVFSAGRLILFQLDAADPDATPIMCAGGVGSAVEARR